MCVFLFIFAFHLINLDGLFVYGMLPIRLNPFMYRNGIGKSRFIFHMVRTSMMAIFILYRVVLCWTSNDVDLLWFDQIAAVLQITLYMPRSQPGSKVVVLLLLSFSSKIFLLDHFSFPKKGFATKPKCNRLQYESRLKSARAEKKHEKKWIELNMKNIK